MDFVLKLIQLVIYNVIFMYKSGTNKIVPTGPTGTVEENKTIGNKGVTIGHFRGKGNKWDLLSLSQITIRGTKFCRVFTKTNDVNDPSRSSLDLHKILLNQI